MATKPLPANTPLDEVCHAVQTELDERTIEVPLLPSVAAEVTSSTLDDKANAARLAELIQQDQGLASHLLRVVNSPAFRGASEIVALQQALARLGMERIREIALSVSLKSTLYKKGPFDSLIEDAWQKGLRTALWGKEVARMAKKNVEMAYLCGLLHNVGISLIVNRLAVIAPDLSIDEVREVSNRLERSAGVLLVEEWRLPSAVGVCIRFLDNFDDAKNAQDLVAVVQGGLLLAQAQQEILEEQEQELDTSNLVAEEVFQHLNFYPNDLHDLSEFAPQVQLTIEGMA